MVDHEKLNEMGVDVEASRFDSPFSLRKRALPMQCLEHFK